jgi:hypothetical protein
MYRYNRRTSKYTDVQSLTVCTKINKRTESKIANQAVYNEKRVEKMGRLHFHYTRKEKLMKNIYRTLVPHVISFLIVIQFHLCNCVCYF